MRAMGFAIGPGDVVTSAQTAARMLGQQLECGSKVLVIGTDALAAEVAGVGLEPVRSQNDGPVAVVQGHSPDTDWGCLAEGVLAIRDGATWIACNADATFPTERGLVPGNGSMVAALRAATGAEPLVVGKPAPHMVREALSRGCLEAPLVVGDRLETDIAAANCAGLPSLLVLSGVSSASDAIHAAADCRPSHLAEDIGGLALPVDSVRISPQPGWHVEISEAEVTVTSANGHFHSGLSVIRAIAHAVWRSGLDGRRPVITAGDRYAQRALRRWDLIDA